MSQTYYDLLGVSQTASFDEIKRAFRQKAKACHPDYHPNDKEAERQFKAINEAYEVLKDEQKRAAYDQYGHEAFVNGMGAGAGRGFGGFDFSGSGFESIFEEMFNGFSGGARRTRTAQRRGADKRVDLTVTLEEAYRGLKKKVSVETYVPCEACQAKGGKNTETCATCGGQGHIRQRQGFFVMETECPVCHGMGKTVKDPCGSCQGTGRVYKKRTLEVNIPAGVDTGVRMRLSGEGDAGLNGSAPGDLYVFLSVKEHELFKREGEFLFCEVPLPMTTAALGGEVLVPTIDGQGEKVTVKAGLQSGTQIRLKGKGMPQLKGNGFGDLFVEFKVETPTHLTARQKELLTEFATAGQGNQSACDAFVDKIKKFFGS